MKFEWENISEDGMTCRAKTIGGWIVKYESPIGNTLVFVPDLKYSWAVQDNAFLDGLISDVLPLSRRSECCLIAEDIMTVRQLLQTSEQRLLKIPNFGRSSLDEVRQVLSHFNLNLKIT